MAAAGHQGAFLTRRYAPVSLFPQVPHPAGRAVEPGAPDRLVFPRRPSSRANRRRGFAAVEGFPRARLWWRRATGAAVRQKTSCRSRTSSNPESVPISAGDSGARSSAGPGAARFASISRLRATPVQPGPDRPVVGAQLGQVTPWPGSRFPGRLSSALARSGQKPLDVNRAGPCRTASTADGSRHRDRRVARRQELLC